MKKYLIDDKFIFIDKNLDTYLLEKYKHKQKDIKCSWYIYDENNKSLYSPIYFELKSSLNGHFDFSILKRETLDVIDFISKNFNIRKDLIRIYFNGKDGFYLVIPGIVTGLFDVNNINKAIKRIAEYIKEKINVKNLRLDIYELNSYHIKFNTQNKNTNLFLLNLSIDLLNKFTYKKLVDYASCERNKRFFGRVNYRVTKIEPSILQIIKDCINEKEVDTEEIDIWLDGYVPYKIGINKNSVNEFYRRCETIDNYRELLNEAQSFYRHMILQSNKFKGYEKQTFLNNSNYDLIIMLLNYLYIKDSKYQICTISDKSSSYDKVICKIDADGADIILYLSHSIIGNEDIFIEINNHIGNLNFEEIIEITATVFIYLESKYKEDLIK